MAHIDDASLARLTEIGAKRRDDRATVRDEGDLTKILLELAGPKPSSEADAVAQHGAPLPEHVPVVPPPPTEKQVKAAAVVAAKANAKAKAKAAKRTPR